MQFNPIPATQIVSLDGAGEWLLATDPQNIGRENAWWNAPRPDAQRAKVPWIIQDSFPEYHGVAWYWREFQAPQGQESERALLRFEAVDYLADVWLNDVHVGHHEGGETPFTLDVSDAIRSGKTNRLAVRVLNPSNVPIDGIRLLDTPRRCKFVPYGAGAAFNHGGLTGSVELLIVPEVRVEQLWVRAELADETFLVQANVRNAGSRTVSASVEFHVAPAMSGETLRVVRARYEFAPGDTLVDETIPLRNPRLWNLNDPFLYRVSARLEIAGSVSDLSTRCGFRDFRFENGYFRLNGKRLFLRGTHTLNHTPVGLQIPHDPDLLRRDLLNLKVMGFNMVRFIWGGAVPYQLDLCDEIGLLVYNESYAAFPFNETAHMGERFDRSISEVIARDRNHPSVVIWGLLNEVHDNALFQHAVDALAMVRVLDPTRMVMLNSGRWDKRMNLGSFSNPGSSTWDVRLGREGETTLSPDGQAPVTPPPTLAAHGDDEEIPADLDAALRGISSSTKDEEPSNLSHGHEAQPVGAAASGAFGTSWATVPGYVMDMGDVHPYPRVPHLKMATELLRRLGEGSKHVLLSEYGIGSAVDLWRVTRHYERMGATHAEDATFYRDKLDKYLRDYNNWKLDELFSGPPEFFKQSLAKMAGQRLLGLNAIRSNSNLAGYSLTGAIDHVMCGEGLTTLFRELKPGTVDALFEGLAPLRLCLFVEPPHIYRGDAVRLEATLANEDVLAPDDYQVKLQVIGPNMERVWEKTATVTVAPCEGEIEPPLALAFVDETVFVDGPQGQYRFIATFEAGAAPTGGECEFHLTDAAQMPAVDGEITLWGEDAALSGWLDAHGIATRRFESEANGREVILVSHAPAEGGIHAWRELARRVARGATAIFLSPDVFARGEDLLGWLPLENRGQPTSIWSWLYLKDEWAKRHPFFDGLPAGALMDNIFYREIIPDTLWTEQDAPLEAVCGAIKASQDYASGLMLCVHALGAGRLVLNTLHIRENLGSHPVAERLLRNILRDAARNTASPLAELPADFDETTLARLYRPNLFTDWKRQWKFVVASLQEPPIRDLEMPDLSSTKWRDVGLDSNHFVNFHALDGATGGLIWVRGEIEVPISMKVEVAFGTDGPCKVWVDSDAVGIVENADNPAWPDTHLFPVELQAGRHTITVAFTRRGGAAWGFFARFKRVDERFSNHERDEAVAILPVVDP